jgi:hypothetical protein
MALTCGDALSGWPSAVTAQSGPSSAASRTPRHGRGGIMTATPDEAIAATREELIDAPRAVHEALSIPNGADR